MSGQSISARSIVIAPQNGTQSKPRDFVSFQGWARAFLAYHGIPKDRLVIIDNTQRPRAMRAATIKAIEAAASIRRDGYPDVVAWFCHGFSNRLQLGWTSETLRPLAEAIATTYSQDVRVVLYACSTAKLEHGFAWRLWDELVRAGATNAEVTGHTTAGRADANPFCRRFDLDGDDWIISPESPWFRTWKRALRGDMRWRMATMTTAEIRAEIGD